ncbi:MAG: Na+/H+ antiporter NhaA [Acidimicrobiales bacterium]
MPQPAPRPTWLSSEARLARYLAQPVVRFLQVEAAGGLLLLAATVTALIWASSPWSAGYDSLWTTELSLRAGPLHLDEDLRHWVNDGLMAIFFFVAGLEIKRELVTGQLAARRDAALPVAAAVGGMVVPALVYLAINVGGPGARGWGIPMATDIAFALGVLALLSRRIPPGLSILLLSLAIVDDIGAVTVIALFYTDTIALGWLAAAVLGLVVVALMRRGRVWSTPAYVAVGVGVWICTLESGIHATIAGVALGLLTPARPLLPQVDADLVADRLSSDAEVTPLEVREVAFELRESVPVAERLEHLIHPWTSFLIIPLFALANAGIPLSRSALADAAGSAVTVGVVVGLVLGKVVGVGLGAWLAVRVGIARLPDEIGWRHILGLSSLAGIGFTVSIFVSALAFDDPDLQQQAKIGVLIASTIAAGIGVAVLRGAAARPQPEGVVVQSVT